MHNRRSHLQLRIRRELWDIQCCRRVSLRGIWRPCSRRLVDRTQPLYDTQNSQHRFDDILQVAKIPNLKKTPTHAWRILTWRHKHWLQWFWRVYTQALVSQTVMRDGNGEHDCGKRKTTIKNKLKYDGWYEHKSKMMFKSAHSYNSELKWKPKKHIPQCWLSKTTHALCRKSHTNEENRHEGPARHRHCCGHSWHPELRKTFRSHEVTHLDKDIV